ncbi:OB-fold protein [Klebsiella pneumoniae]|uniref:OB-fold protein n=1 Tax=Klebsiella pneumoniae TaxID=573 RepID=UPI00073C3F2E|nr:hypothetical protein [Klebsiella pneumoniae]KSW37745.1 hypothetical protein APT65_11670 [Klebsiella pneumoniae]
MAEPLGVFAPKNPKAFSLFNKAMQDDEVRVFLKGGDCLTCRETQGPYSASALIKKYKQNELAANKELKGKNIRVRTIASEIGEDFRGKAYIRADGDNPFESINMYVDGNDERFLKMSSGDRVDLVCSEIKYIMHTPMLDSCIMSSDFVRSFFYPVDKEVIASTEPANKYQAILSFLYKYKENSLEKACLKTEKICTKEIKSITMNGEPPAEFKALAEANKEKAKRIISLFESDK